jgi:hypothetical protein
MVAIESGASSMSMDLEECKRNCMRVVGSTSVPSLLVDTVVLTCQSIRSNRSNDIAS